MWAYIIANAISNVYKRKTWLQNKQLKKKAYKECSPQDLKVSEYIQWEELWDFYKHHLLLFFQHHICKVMEIISKILQTSMSKSKFKLDYGKK
jgi:hypothetical protein